MQIVGELINTSRGAVHTAVDNLDAAFIQGLAAKQVEAGADYVDVNAGTFVGKEGDKLCWLVETVQARVETPLALDTPDPEALRRALAVHRGRPLINSITGETGRWETMLPVVAEAKAAVIALCLDDAGMPQSAADRLRVAGKLVRGLEGAGVSMEDIYLDPLVCPVSTDTSAALAALEAIGAMRREFPGVHAICGLSNVSYGLPKRRLLNNAFCLLAMQQGLDAVLLDPLDRSLISLIQATQTLLGKDEYCMAYIQAVRENRLT